MEKVLVVSEEYCGQRLDKFLYSQLQPFSRTKIYRLVKEGLVSVDGKEKKAGFRLKLTQQVIVTIEEKRNELKPFDFPVKIIYEDNDIIVVDKPLGLVVHPLQVSYHKTLVNALIHLKKELAPTGALRPGIVHRLDKETSGVMVIAKNKSSYLGLVSQFKERRVTKEYRAISWGSLKEEKMLIDLPLSRDEKNRLKMKVNFLRAKQARTEVEVIARLRDSTYLRLRPHTGRMHQIRVHLKFLNLPIIGDKKYGIEDEYKELFLHAKELSFFHPQSAKRLKFSSPLPERFKRFLKENKMQ